MYFTGKKIRSKSSMDGNLVNWLKVEIIAVKGPMAVISTGATIVQVNVSELDLWTADLEELRDSRERARAPVLWLSCGGQIDVWEMFSDNSYLRAILDRQ